MDKPILSPLGTHIPRLVCILPQSRLGGEIIRTVITTDVSICIERPHRFKRVVNGCCRSAFEGNMEQSIEFRIRRSARCTSMARLARALKSLRSFDADIQADLTEHAIKIYPNLPRWSRKAHVTHRHVFTPDVHQRGPQPWLATVNRDRGVRLSADD